MDILNKLFNKKKGKERKMKRIAINGFGRIGRVALRQISKRDDMEVVAINSRSEAMELAYLYKYDSIHRTLEDKVGYDDEHIVVNGKKIKSYKQEDPSNLPWKELDIDIVLECTGAFTSKEGSMKHINAGAKKVAISAPAKDDTKTIVAGVNEELLTSEDIIISCASCTTNCLAPVLNLIHKNYHIVKGFMSTVHAITNDQEVLDVTHKKGAVSRRGRSALLNIIPTSTGAASQIGKVIPDLDEVIDGVSYRVPVGDGSLINATLELEKYVTKEEVNKMFKDNQSDVVKITNAPIVSGDIIGSECGALVDASLTNTVEKDGKVLLSITAWYDNEWGYTAQMLRTISKWN